MRAWTSKPCDLPAFSVFCSNELVRLLIVGEAEGLAVPLESLLRESHGDVAQQDCFRERSGEVERRTGRLAGLDRFVSAFKMPSPFDFRHAVTIEKIIREYQWTAAV